ncbi:Ig-like domain-containing protein, partial [Scandinavium sp. M-37]|uniref:Ig-like domain-containing protein n=1 Tax=Scandinavium sp. M-37 TaxID=3373077 RepID=UPI0037461866
MSDSTEKQNDLMLAATDADYTSLITIDSVFDNTGQHQGRVAQYGETDDLLPTLTGFVPYDTSGALILRIYLNSVPIGTAHVEADGSWTYTAETPLKADTLNYFTAVLLDPGDNSQLRFSDPYYINTTAPDQDIVTPDVPETPVIDSVVDNVRGYHGFTGALHDGDVTNDATPTLSGHATAGTLVNIYDNHALIGSVTANADGSWTLTLPELADGTHNLTATTAVAGAESDATADFTVTVDTVISKPILDYIDDAQGTQQGTVADGGLTDDSQPVLHGHAEANSRVDIHVFGPNGKELYYKSVTADEDGNWTYQTKPFTTQGTYSFGISGVDQAGNAWAGYGDKYSIEFVGSNQDVVAPDAPVIDSVTDNVAGYHGFTGTLHNGDATNDATPTLSGHATAGTLVNIYDNHALIASVTANADGSWTQTLPELADGKHNLTATAAVAGVESAPTADFNVTVDTVISKPVLDYIDDAQGTQQGTVADGGLTDDSQPVLHGHAEANSRVDIHVFGPNGKELYYDSVTANADGSWTYQPKPFTTQGTYSFGISGVDQVGNAWYDYGDKYSVKFVGENQDDTTPPDAPTITNATDNVGPVTGSEVHNNGVTDDSTPELHGHAEAGSLVKVYEGTTLLGSINADSNGNWSITMPVRTDGSHTFTATATDAAGNISGYSGNFVVTVDTHTAMTITGLQDDTGTVTGLVAD